MTKPDDNKGCFSCDSLDNAPPTTQKTAQQEEYLPVLFGKCIGSGGFSKCYQVAFAEDKTNEIYAGKCILTQKRKYAAVEYEAIIHKKLSEDKEGSKYFVKFINAFWLFKKRYFCLVTEMCNQATLYDILTVRKTGFDEKSALHYFQQIVDGVAFLHSRFIIHHDLKLHNFFLDKNNTNILKIGDFGCAREITESIVFSAGTPNYIAPEVIEGKPHDRSVDIWSLGVCLYTMLVGKHPFSTNSIKNTYEKIIKCDYVIPDYVSVKVRKLIQSMLMSKPKDRPDVLLLKTQIDNFMKNE